MCVGVFLLRLLFPKINEKPTVSRSRSEIRGSPGEEGDSRGNRFKSSAQARSVRAGSVRVASLASRSDSVATGPSAQCTTFTRAVGAGDHSASSRRAASELVRSPPVCCRLPVAQIHAHKSVTSPPTHTPRPLHVFTRKHKASAPGSTFLYQLLRNWHMNMTHALSRQRHLGCQTRG